MDIEKVLDNFKKNDFNAVYFNTSEEACDYLCGKIKNTSVGIGGSVGIKQINLHERLSEKNEIFCNWIEPGQEALDGGARADVYVLSANGLSETGEIVNIDGRCNRVSSSLFGHDSVYFVCGINKLTPDLDSAINRARNIASPLNARRLGCDTPCSTGEIKCHDCNSPDRICRALVVLWKKPTGIRHAEVVLIGENIGF